MNALHYFIIGMCFIPIAAGIIAFINPLDFNTSIDDLYIKTPHFNSKNARKSKLHWEFAQKEYSKMCIISGILLLILNFAFLIPIFSHFTINKSDLAVHILFAFLILCPYFIILFFNTYVLIEYKLKKR